MINLKNKIVTVIGAQKSGIAAAELACKFGADVRLTDAADTVSDGLLRWAKETHVEVETGGHTCAFIESSDYVVVSPGVSIYTDIIVHAKARGICVLGEVEFAFQFAQAPVIAVTGSNGKTTVATLSHQIVEASDQLSVLCGNIGVPFSAVVKKCTQPDYFVVEVSSFQLESMLDEEAQHRFGITGFQPYIAILLNINQNHLDRHKDMNEYTQAKLRLFMNQKEDDYAIVNHHLDKLLLRPSRFACSTVVFNREDNGVNPNKQVLDGLANILNINPEHVDAVYTRFDGVEHRLESVGTVAGVHFVNDSKSTTVESGLWALRNISEPVILLCGGRDKNLDFTTIAEAVCDRVKAVIVYGEAKEKIYAAFKEHTSIFQVEDLSAAFDLALETSEAGDQILLSPMCASFDAFRNFEERGHFFKRLVGQYQDTRQDVLNA